MEKSFFLNFRTDMADERFDTYKKVNNLSEIEGIKVDTKENGKAKITMVNVIDENGARAISKEIGKYITIGVEDIKYLEENDKQDIIYNIAEEIYKLIDKDKKKNILVVGLGNIYVTPDALGPKVVKYIDITRHLLKFAKELVTEDTRSISSIAPGVLGTTGIETSEIIFSIVEKTKPDLLIVIDSLASGSISRIGKTIQISNTGITPGAGVKNTRYGININTIGIPVIAIGVPTVVDMATITNEAIDKMLENVKNTANEFEKVDENQTKEVFKIFEKDGRYNMIANALNAENYIVTPKDIDDIIDKVSEIVASSINVAVQK